MSADAGGAGLLPWLAGGVFLLLTMLVAVMAALLERSGPIRLRHWAQEAGGRLAAMYERPARLEAFRYLLSLLARVLPLALLLAVWRVLADRHWQQPALWALVAAVAWLCVTEGLNRLLVARDPETALRRLTVGYRLAMMAVSPLVALLSPLLSGQAIERREDEDDVSEQEIEAFIDVGTREGILEPGEDDLIMRVIDFGDAVVKSVITPRIEMVCAQREASLDELADLFLTAKHSRIPLYTESVDQIVGILHIRDLLDGLRQQQPPPAAELANPPYVVPETKPLNELLREFQTSRQQMAIVVDEFGGTVGLVTVEDLLEEIVGEIVDEHEELQELNQALPDGSWKLDGATPIDTLNELFGADVSTQPYETVGGLVFGLLGHLPEVGAKVEALGLVMTVLRVEARRIKSVIVQRPPADEEAAS